MSEMRIDRAAMHRRAQQAEAEVQRLQGEMAEWKRLYRWWMKTALEYRRELGAERKSRALRRVTDGGRR